MVLNSTLSFDTLIDLENFEQCQRQRAEEILIRKFLIPESDAAVIRHQIFNRIRGFTNQKPILLEQNSLWKAFHTFAVEETDKLKKEMSKNFGLTFNGFEKMCNDMRLGDEELFEQIFLSHFEDCMNYLKSNYRLNHEQAYDVSMDTLLIFRHKLIQKKIAYGNIRYLFTKMASQVFLKQKAKNKKLDGLTYETEVKISEETLVLLEKAISCLGEGCQELLKMNFYDKLSLTEIAEIKQKSSPAVRKQKQRCIEKLKSLFESLSKL